MKWKLNLTVIIILASVLLGCSTVKDKIIKLEGTNVRIQIKNIVPMNDGDRLIAEKSLLLNSKIDPNQVYPYLPKCLFWANLGKEYYGLTVTYGNSTNFVVKAIYVDRKSVLSDKNDPIEWLHFGALLSHELHHYFYDSSDPETGKITDAVIYRKLAEDPLLLKRYIGWWKELKQSL